MKPLKSFSQIEIDSISTGKGDRFYLKISYRVIDNKCHNGRVLSLQDEELMLALFDAQLINSWDVSSVYFDEDSYSVGGEGEFIREIAGMFCSKYDFLRRLEDDQALQLIWDQLLSL